MNQEQEIDLKFKHLKQKLANLGSVAVAFSGGVDSAFLLKTAHDVLGGRAAAVTIQSAVFPVRESDEAADFCKRYKIRQSVHTLDPLKIEGFAENPPNRCYLCKYQMMQAVLAAAQELKLVYAAEGSNTDDAGDYRPGHHAVAELGILSPLREAGLSKAEIRELSRQMGLPTWDKQSYACLASRFVYGEEITPEKLVMVGRAEQLLLDLGFHQMRVRIHGRMARIEVLPQEFCRLMEEKVREQIVKSFQAYGFTYVTMDLKGYRTGSMNEAIGLRN
ncbi:MAG: ATP-dependent sacrificial sulfur transferase LarE [Eubacterium sp.]|nr:ATP-dependent sacrificial sulfur transferase LarE [Eubacterium sp.]